MPHASKYEKNDGKWKSNRRAKQGKCTNPGRAKGEYKQREGLENRSNGKYPATAETRAQHTDSVKAKKRTNTIARAQYAKFEWPLMKNIVCKNGQDGLVGKRQKIHDHSNEQRPHNRLAGAYVLQAFAHQRPRRGFGNRGMTRYFDAKHDQE